jgi:hypothetical protein
MNNSTVRKMKMVELGLPIPHKNETVVLAARNGQIFYLFASIPKANDPADWRIGGYLFDMAQYRRHPFGGIPAGRKAFRLFIYAIAEVEGFDVKQKIFATTPSPSRN